MSDDKSSEPEPPAPSSEANLSTIPKALSEEEARRLDQECYARFIKVNVKHITDGQVSFLLHIVENINTV